MPHFRFHGELNDLLRPELRDRSFDWPCARRASAKHAIEAIGVPHTEVGRLLLDGHPATLGHLLRETDSLEVFPATPPVLAAGAPPPRFLADAHLGGLARRLRLLGFDTELARDAPDRSLAGLADGDGRILLSRDRELLEHRRVTRGRYVRARDTDGQLREVIAHFGLRERARPFTRCLECNCLLRPAGLEEVAGRLPPGVAGEHTSFTVCAGCKRVYWAGSHWRRLRAVVDEVAGAAPARPPCGPGRQVR